MPDEDAAAMSKLAPYAADYAPVVMKYMKPVMAGAFVGIWGMSIVTRMKLLSTLEKEALVRLNHANRNEAPPAPVPPPSNGKARK
jgi:hypothetical protein